MVIISLKLLVLGYIKTLYFLHLQSLKHVLIAKQSVLFSLKSVFQGAKRQREIFALRLKVLHERKKESFPLGFQLNARALLTYATKQAVLQSKIRLSEAC